MDVTELEKLPMLSAAEAAARHCLGDLPQNFRIDPATLGRFSSVEDFIGWLSSDEFYEETGNFAFDQKQEADSLEAADTRDYLRSLGEILPPQLLAEDEAYASGVSVEVHLGLHDLLPPASDAGGISLEKGFEKTDAPCLPGPSVGCSPSDSRRSQAGRKRRFARNKSKSRFSADFSRKRAGKQHLALPAPLRKLH